MKLTISALLPVRNGSMYLSECIRSVEANGNQLSEIIVVDDGSWDSTPQLLTKWSKENNKVQIITTRGIGLIAALNLGMKNCSGDFVARFDVDDEYSSNRLEEQCKVITQRTVSVFSDYEIFSNDLSESLGNFPSPVFPNATSVSLIRNRRTPHPSALISRNAFYAVGGYRDQDFLVEDLSLWLRLSRVGDLVTVPKSLLKYRISNSSISLNNRKEMQKRRSILLEEIKVNYADYISSFDRAEIILRAYKESVSPKVRSLLFLHELNLVGSSLNSSEGAKISRMILHLGLQPVGSFEYLNYFQQIVKRIRYRHKLTSDISS